MPFIEPKKLETAVPEVKTLSENIRQKQRRLTIKQQKFVKRVVETGNATEAAMEVYDVKHRSSAGAVASENLQKPAIYESIKAALHNGGIDEVYITEKLKKSLEAGIGVKANNGQTLRALDMILKATGSYPDKKSAHLRFNINANQIDYSKLTRTELLQHLEKLRKNTEMLLTDMKPMS